MGFHDQLSQWFHQLGQSLDSGIAVGQALKALGGPGRRQVDSIVQALEAGESLDAALMKAPKWLSEGDRMLLSAGGEAGRLPTVCYSLSRSHRRMAANKKEWGQALLYPAFLVHISILLNPLMAPMAFMEKISEGTVPGVLYYLNGVVPLLLWVWAIVLIFRLLWKKVSLFRKVFILLLPGLKGFLAQISISKFAETLESLLEAGVSADEAYGGAAIVAGPSTIQRKVLKIIPEIQRGASPGTLFQKYKILSNDYLSLFLTGVQTGRITANLMEISLIADNRASARLRSMRFWYSKLVYLLVAIFVALQAMQAMQGYLDQIMSIQ